MPESKRYVYTDLSVKDCLYLEIEGTKFPVVQYNDSYAVNEIPVCQILLGVGRKVSRNGDGARTAMEAAEANKNNKYRRMKKAKVVFQPNGEANARGDKWPEKSSVIFEGYFTGFFYRKVMGKMQVSANLLHWTAALMFSSATAGNAHVGNPASLNEAAVLDALDSSGSSAGCYLSQAAPTKLLQSAISEDLWKSIKELFCALASIETKPLAASDQCQGGGDFTANDSALEALKKIEGDAKDCNFASDDGGSKYAVPLKLETLSETVRNALCEAIAWQSVTTYANSTFWDKLVGEYCPMFGLAFVPMAQRGLVIADVPSLRDQVWRTVLHTEHTSFDMSAMLERPLRAVGVLPTFVIQTDGMPQSVLGQRTGGCFAPKGQDTADGLVRLVSAPPWLTQPAASLDDVLRTSGLDGNGVSRAVGADAPGKDSTKAGDAFGDSLSQVYSKYAQMIYANEMLRGRNGSFDGPLRFDIAPGSVIRIKQEAEKFLGAEDDLAGPVLACVARVSNVINAEAPAAGTSFTLTHMRWENTENDELSSLEGHPFFGKSIHGGGKHGAPLVTAYEFPEKS